MLRPLNTLAQLQQANASLSACGCSSAQKIVRKYRKAHKKRLQRKEYRNLQKIVPSVAAKGKISKVTVIEEAIRYIDQLHHALAQRLQSSQGAPSPVSADSIQELAQQSFLAKKRGEKCPAQLQHLLPSSSMMSQPPMTSSSPAKKPLCDSQVLQ